jgi:cardiolipin synthase
MNLPNTISIIRIIITPVLILSIINGFTKQALILFILAAISDFLDGFLARRFKSETIIGSYLDPIADKILISTTYLVFFYEGYISYWITVIVITRDILILIGSIISFFLHKKPKVIPIKISKVNTMIQLLYIFWILNYISSPSVFHWKTDLILVIITSFTTIFSGIFYIKKYFKNMKTY